MAAELHSRDTLRKSKNATTSGFLRTNKQMSACESIYLTEERSQENMYIRLHRIQKIKSSIMKSRHPKIPQHLSLFSGFITVTITVRVESSEILFRI